MNPHKLKQLVIDLENEQSVKELPEQEIIDALVSREEVKAKSAARLLRLEAVDPDSLPRHSEQINMALTDTSPVVQKDLLLALEQLGESDATKLDPFIETLFACPDSRDPAVRVQAVRVLLIIARREPDRLHPYADQFAAVIDDSDRRSVANVLATINRLLGHGDDSSHSESPEHIERQLLRAEFIDLAVMSLEEANGNLRTASIDYLAQASDRKPGAVAPHASELRKGLTDPFAHIRSQTGYIFSNIVEHDTGAVQPHLPHLVPLLRDPEELARLNATVTFLSAGISSPSVLPTHKIAEMLPTLLQTEVVAVQEQAIYLTHLTIKDDTIVFNTDGIYEHIEKLRHESAISVEDGVFEEILDQLDPEPDSAYPDDTTTESQRSPPTKADSDQQSSSHSTRSTSGDEGPLTNEREKIFSGTGSYSCPVCGESIGQSAAFCPECGEKLLN